MTGVPMRREVWTERAGGVRQGGEGISMPGDAEVPGSWGAGTAPVASGGAALPALRLASRLWGSKLCRLGCPVC